MKKIYSLLFLLTALVFTVPANAQLVGGNVYLQGQWLEIGEISNGAMGTCVPPPASYHPHCSFCAGGTNNLAEVYDWGHDGWAVGIPPYMGDYTNPGFPFEGWALEVNGSTNEAYQNYCAGGYPCCSFFPSTPTGTLTGGLTTYSNSSGVILSNWAGTASSGNLKILSETRVDTNASWVVFTVKFYNTSALPINNVYYERTCDPDNESTWSGLPGYTGAYSTTEDTIVYQNDWDHRVMVAAYGNFGSFNKTNSYMALGTKDCRAKCTYFDASHGTGNFGSLQPGWSPADIWAQTPTTYGYAVGTHNYADEGYGLVFNLGTICANDSAVISMAYIFNGDNGIDSAFPDPLINVNNGSQTVYPTFPYTLPPYNFPVDTFDACFYPGLDSIPLNVLFGGDKGWTWSSWTWSPSTGLSATTGLNVWAYINSIPGSVTYTVTGTDSFGPGCNNNPCLNKTFIFTIKSCHSANNNSPCFGDALMFGMTGESLGATYYWYGPNKFTSFVHDPVIYPAVLGDTGVYYVIKTIGGISDTDSTVVVVHPKPTLVVSDNSPMCAASIDTLNLSATPFTPGESFAWTGPSGYTSNVEFPSIDGFIGTNVGTYTVVATTSFGCKDTGYVAAALIPQPLAPVISGPNVYCQYTPFVAFTTSPATGILWYNVGAGGTPSTVAPVVNTSVVGVTTVYASQKTGSCESPRASYTVTVNPTPPIPAISGSRADYCQFTTDTFVYATVTLSGSSYALWYTAPTGGTPSLAETAVPLNIAGTTTFYVSQKEGNCESPRAPVTITVHPKPLPPTPPIDSICQYWTPGAFTATLSETGDVLKWYNVYDTTTPFTVTPIPQTLVPGVDSFYINEVSAFGCASNMKLGLYTVIPKPSAPLTRDTIYCQFTAVPALTADSAVNSRLNWYLVGTKLPGAPTPTNAIPGDIIWYVSQTVHTCESDSLPIKVTTIYKPQFTIAASSPYVCQFDSISLAYNGPVIDDPSYVWSLPVGAFYARGKGVMSEAGISLPTDSMIYVKFDSVTQNNYVGLHVTDDHGFCAGDTTLRIRVVPQPTGVSTTRADVCAGDTVILALGNKSPGASDFTWKVDGVPMESSSALSIIAHNSNSGGLFSISWNDSGRHVVTLSTSTAEGCLSQPTDDSVDVHTSPDATFAFTTRTGELCLEDSVLFTATTNRYNNSYVWAPAHFFANDNKAVIWGKVEQLQSIITLTVTDPFGCAASFSQEIDPGTCCTVAFPTSFTPSGSSNKVFKPIYVGYHRFHVFRIENRWGQTVFESTNSNMAWDGGYNGVPQETGVYFYYLSYDCGGNTIEKRGDVTLVR